MNNKSSNAKKNSYSTGVSTWNEHLAILKAQVASKIKYEQKELNYEIESLIK